MNKNRVVLRFTMLFILVLSGTFSFAQKESSIWYFGRNAGLDFREHWPLPLTDGRINATEGVASVSDKEGNLLFYTDGQTIWNRNHGVMASGLSADSASTHAVTIIPNRLDSTKYFVFTTNSITSAEDDNYGGNYYIVDFSNDPLGELIYDNYEKTGEPGILKNSTEKFAAVPFSDEISETESVPAYRILMHEWGNNKFAHFNLDSLIRDYREQELGSWHLDSLYYVDSIELIGTGANGQIKVSMMGDKVAVALEGERRFEVYDFDKETGELSNPLWLAAGDRENGKTRFARMAYGVEFSPSGRFLYGTSKDEGMVYQWDLDNVDYEIRKGVKYIRNNPEINCGALQLAPNGKIYVALEGQDYLAVINSPNNEECEFEEFGARLLDNDTDLGGLSSFGLPATVPNGAEPEAFYYNNTCLGETTSFYITNPYSLRTAVYEITEAETNEPVTTVTGYRDEELEKTFWEYRFLEAGVYNVTLQALYYDYSTVVSTRQITIHEPPVSKWPQDTVICYGQTLELDAGNGAFYYWVEAGARDRYLYVDSLGRNPATGQEFIQKKFRVFVTHYNGCLTMDSIMLKRRQPPELSYESTEAKCDDLNGTATVIPNGPIENYTYSWVGYPGETSNKLTGLGGGDYTVFVRSIETGCEASIVIPVGAQGAIRIIPSVDTLVCPGTEVILTAVNADFADWIIPEGTTEKQIIVSPDVTTTYRVRGVSNYGGGDVCVTEAEYTVEVAPINIPELGEDLSACYGDTLTLEAPDNYLEYVWDNGMMGKVIRLTESDDELILYAVDTNYCTFFDDIAVTFHVFPDLEVKAGKALCGQMNGSGSVIPKGNPDDYLFVWEDFPNNSTNKIFDVGAGKYSVNVTYLVTGCDTTVNVIVSEFGAPDTRIIASDEGPVCPGTPVTLRAENADYYTWVNPEGLREAEIVVEPYIETTYTVIGAVQDEEGNECRSYAEVTIEVLPYYKPDIGPDQDACEGDTIFLDGNEIYQEWSWSNGMSGRNIQLTKSEPDLVLTAIDDNNCAVTDTASITFYPYPLVDLGEDQTVCTNEPVILNGGLGDTYLWSTGETSQQISVIEKGLYWVEISSHGCMAADSLYLQLVNPDSIRIDSVIKKDISCFGEIDGEINIYAHGSGDTYLYSIDEGMNYFDNGGRFENLAAGDFYRIRVLEDSVCARDYGQAIIINEPAEIEASYKMSSPSCDECLDGQIEITLIEGGSPPFDILWDNNDTAMIRKDIGTGSYYVNISDSRDCYTDLFFELDLSYRIPNAFTPNDDGVNDVWKVGIIEYYPEAVIKIFDKKGQLIFESPPGYPEPWDGKVDGEFVLMGTYYYLIYLEPGMKPTAGYLTVLR